MIEFFVTIALAASLLLLVLIWLRVEAHKAGVGGHLSFVRSYMVDLHLEPPPRAVAERIFDASDLEFISKQTPRGTPALFLRERKRLALYWLGYQLKRLRQLREFHAAAVRVDARVQAAAEFQLALKYALCVVNYWLVACLVQTCGPFTARRAMRGAMGSVDYFWLSTERILGLRKRESLEKIKNAWLRETDIG